MTDGKRPTTGAGPGSAYGEGRRTAELGHARAPPPKRELGMGMGGNPLCLAAWYRGSMALG